jgi:hypothetical protein
MMSLRIVCVPVVCGGFVATVMSLRIVFVPVVCGGCVATVMSLRMIFVPVECGGFAIALRIVIVLSPRVSGRLPGRTTRAVWVAKGRWRAARVLKNRKRRK